MTGDHFYTPNTCGGCQRYGTLDPYTIISTSERLTVWLHSDCASTLRSNAKDLTIEPAVQYLVIHPSRPTGKR